MPWEDLLRSVQRVASAKPQASSRRAALWSMAWLSALAGVVVAAILIPGLAFSAASADRLTTQIRDLPLQLSDTASPQTSTVLSSDGQPIAFFYEENRQDVALSDISPVMRTAIIDTEDYRFYQHGALDLKGTLRALINNSQDGQTQGGSTLTQQLVKLTLVEQATTPAQQKAATEKSTARKIRELKLAIGLEEKYSKNQILNKYLNIAYFGDGAYGINSAAYHYFSVSPAELTTQQAALLAGLVKNPEQFNPVRYPDAALNRRNTVLAVMAKRGNISVSEAQKLSEQPLGLNVQHFPNGCVDSSATFSCDYVRRYLLQEPALGSSVAERQDQLQRGGLVIKTNIDLGMQNALNQAVTQTADPTDDVVAAMALVEPGTGKVRGVAQDRPMGSNEAAGQTFLNFTVPTSYGDATGFQAGSTFKMFTTSAALTAGIKTSKTYNAPQNLTMPAGSYHTCDGAPTWTWDVANSTISGTMDMYTALRESVNTYFAQLERDAGLCNTVHAAESMGIKVPTTDQVGPFTLGVTPVSPLQLAAAYAVPASGGMYCKPEPVAQILNRNGQVIKSYDPECTRVMSQEVAATINDILVGLQQPGGFGFSAGTGLNIPSAAKTGTTNDNQAVWYMGYTPQLAAAAMIAGVTPNDEPAPLGGKTLKGNVLSSAQAHGSTLAGPMWKIAMGQIQNQLQPIPFDPPPARQRGAATPTTPAAPAAPAPAAPTP